jgi:hypothetical protein
MKKTKNNETNLKKKHFLFIQESLSNGRAIPKILDSFDKMSYYFILFLKHFLKELEAKSLV